VGKWGGGALGRAWRGLGAARSRRRPRVATVAHVARDRRARGMSSSKHFSGTCDSEGRENRHSPAASS
jgi:hypothetical protein